MENKDSVTVSVNSDFVMTDGKGNFVVPGPKDSIEVSLADGSGCSPDGQRFGALLERQLNQSPPFIRSADGTPIPVAALTKPHTGLPMVDDAVNAVSIMLGSPKLDMIKDLKAHGFEFQAPPSFFPSLCNNTAQR